jgi:hypothetical protein
MITRIVGWLDRSWPWGAMGLTAAILAPLGLLPEGGAEVTIDIVNEVSLSGSENTFPEIVVLLNGDTIGDRETRTRVFTIRVENTGKKDILANHHAAGYPWGVRIDGGRMAGVNLASATSPHISETPVLQGAGEEVLFPRVHLDRKQSFALDLIVVYPEGNLPTLQARGSLSGAPIRLVNSWQNPPSPGLLRTAVVGSLSTQALRLFLYGAGFLLAVVLAGYLGDALHRGIRALNRRLRAGRSREFPVENGNRTVFLRLYRDGSDDLLVKLRAHIGHQSLHDQFRLHGSWDEGADDGHLGIEVDEQSQEPYASHALVGLLVKHGVVEVTEREVRVSQAFQTDLQRVVDHLNVR